MTDYAMRYNHTRESLEQRNSHEDSAQLSTKSPYREILSEIDNAPLTDCDEKLEQESPYREILSEIDKHAEKYSVAEGKFIGYPPS